MRWVNLRKTEFSFLDKLSLKSQHWIQMDWNIQPPKQTNTPPVSQMEVAKRKICSKGNTFRVERSARTACKKKRVENAKAKTLSGHVIYKHGCRFKLVLSIMVNIHSRGIYSDCLAIKNTRHLSLCESSASSFLSCSSWSFEFFALTSNLSLKLTMLLTMNNDSFYAWENLLMWPHL